MANPNGWTALLRPVPDGLPFVEVGFDEGWSVSAKATAAGGTLDTVIEAPVQPRPVYAGVAFTRGMPETVVDRLLAGIAVKYGEPAIVLRREPGGCVFRYRVPAERVEDPAVRVLLAVQTGLGPPWTHIEAGKVVLRAAAPADAGGAMETVRQALQLAGVQAKVGLRRLAGEELAAWRELERRLHDLREQGALDGNRLPSPGAAAARPWGPG